MEVERTGKLQLKLEFMPFIPPMVLSIPEQPSPPLLPRAVHRTLRSSCWHLQVTWKVPIVIPLKGFIQVVYLTHLGGNTLNSKVGILKTVILISRRTPGDSS